MCALAEILKMNEILKHIKARAEGTFEGRVCLIGRCVRWDDGHLFVTRRLHSSRLCIKMGFSRSNNRRVSQYHVVGGAWQGIMWGDAAKTDCAKFKVKQPVKLCHYYSTLFFSSPKSHHVLALRYSSKCSVASGGLEPQPPEYQSLNKRGAISVVPLSQQQIPHITNCCCDENWRTVHVGELIIFFFFFRFFFSFFV